jgi:hypothetical protein
MNFFFRRPSLVSSLLFTLCGWSAACDRAAQAEPPPSVDQRAPASSSARQAPSSDPCAIICAHSVSLGCGTLEDCRSSCGEMRTTPICSSETKALLGCLAAQPIDRYACSTDHAGAEILDGYCDAEQERVASCFEATQILDP